jgi:hypothetical protein
MSDNPNPVPIYLIGVYLGVYYLSVHALMKNTNTTRWQRNFYISYSSVLLLLNTASFIQEPYISRMMWITTRDIYPGGPAAYYNNTLGSDLVTVLGNIAQTIAITLNSGLMESFILTNQDSDFLTSIFLF